MPSGNKNKNRNRRRAYSTGSVNRRPASGGVKKGRDNPALDRARRLAPASGMARPRVGKDVLRQLRAQGQGQAGDPDRLGFQRKLGGQARLAAQRQRAQSMQPLQPVSGPAQGVQRTRLISESMAAEALTAENLRNNRDALNAIYSSYFENGVPRSDWQRKLPELYSMMGRSKTPYASKAVPDADFQKFLATPDALVFAQGLSREAEDEFRSKMNRYRADLRKWQDLPPTRRQTFPEPKRPDNPSRDDVRRGDYFYVQNESGKLARGSEYGRARRIIVNVNNQAAALRVATKLGGLFADDQVSPHLSEFKVYLTQRERESADIKNDKLIIYYRTAPGDAEGEDSVGDRIADTVKGELGPDDVGGTFAPFYSRVGDTGMAYAEEPGYYHYALGGSFTESREQVVADVIKAAAESAKTGGRVPHADEFIRLVNAGLRMSFIDPRNPQRHLTDPSFAPGTMPGADGDPMPVEPGEELDQARTEFQRKRTASVGEMVRVATARRKKAGLKRSERRKKARLAKREAPPTGQAKS